nr:solute carrier family 4 member 11-like [Lytechinus pictus]
MDLLACIALVGRVLQPCDGHAPCIFAKMARSILMEMIDKSKELRYCIRYARTWNSISIPCMPWLGSGTQCFSSYTLSPMQANMKWSTRSTEEIFSLFVSIAFCVDAFKDLAAEFDKHYHASECTGVPAGGLLISTQPSMTTLNDSNTDPTTTLFSNISSQISTTLASSSTPECHRDSSILYLLLMLGTLWLGVTLYNFTKSPFLDASKREALADYALPVAVLIMSFVGSYVFRGTEADIFSYNDGEALNVTKFEGISIGMVAGSMGLGFCLSLLFFMDQNISSALVNNPANK